MIAAPADALTVNVRHMGKARGEAQFVRETTLKVRWPRRSGITWHDWEGAKGRDVDLITDAGTCYVAESGGVLLGFALWRKDGALAMLYVKQAFRGQNIGLRLLPSQNAQVTDNVAVAGGPPIRVVEPTACWKRWADYWGLPWERV